MTTPQCLSPKKENQSPTKLKSSDQFKQLLSFIRDSGLKLPSNLEKSFLHAENIKLIPTDQKETEKEKKLKIRLSDIEFELKKTEEDFASFKRNSRLEREKQTRKWEEAYNELKTNSEENNEDNSIKFMKLKESSQKEILQLKGKHKEEMNQEIKKIQSFYENKLNSQQKLNEREVQELKEKKKKELMMMQETYEQKIQEIKTINEFNMKKVMLKNKQALEFKEKQFEGIYTAIQSEKKTEEKLHQKTKVEASQEKEKLYNELYYERNVKKNLQQTIEQRDKKIKDLKNQIKDLQAQIVVEKEKASKKLKEVKSDNQKRMIGIEQLHKEEKQEILEKYINEIKRVEKTIVEINQWKSNKEHLMEERMVELEGKFDERPSRKEDIQEIQKLKNKVVKRQDEGRQLRKQLKNCALQLENKEEIYNRIFSSQRREKKSSHQKEREEFKSKESLKRKSQTTDIKSLLKVYNKFI